MPKKSRGGFYTQFVDAHLEKKILVRISNREDALKVLDQNLTLVKLHKDWSKSQVLQALCQLRQATIDVIESIVEWRKQLVHPEPFRVMGQNYLLKIAGGDSDYLQTFSAFRHEFGFEIGRENPFVLPIRPVRPCVMEKMEQTAAWQTKKASAPFDQSSKIAKLILWRGEIYHLMKRTREEEPAQGGKDFSSTSEPQSKDGATSITHQGEGKYALALGDYHAITFLVRLVTVSIPDQQRMLRAAKVLFNEFQRSRKRALPQSGFQQWYGGRAYQVYPFALEIIKHRSPPPPPTTLSLDATKGVDPRNINTSNSSRDEEDEYKPQGSSISIVSSSTTTTKGGNRLALRQQQQHRFKGVPSTTAIRERMQSLHIASSNFQQEKGGERSVIDLL